MKILIAGATGAIGQPLMQILEQHSHQIYGITQSKEHFPLIQNKGGKPVILDVLDREAVLSALEAIQPDIVIDMLTRLPKEYTPQAMRDAAAMDARIRTEGGANLQEAAEKNGVRRYILQSSGFWYAPGTGLADENTPFAFQATPGIASGTKVYAALENRVMQTKQIEGVALRFGFYGPGTWFYPSGNMGHQVKMQQFPIIGSGEGVWNFVHIEDAAQAIVSALDCKPGIYNIINDQPSKMNDWLPAFANSIQAPKPPIISEDEGLKLRGPDSVYYATKLRAASNAKAKRELNFKPRSFEWLMSGLV
ncbi:MAG: NAD(P)-dependent oxidoreductase [Parachlamydiaceae bacterium]|nr:MAG: NAD(P)-dependent oxidoreductase [Parachlamydiaceae bacterium]